MAGFELDFGKCTVMGVETATSKKGNQYGILAFLDQRFDYYRVFVGVDALDMVRNLEKGQTVGLVFSVQPAFGGQSGFRFDLVRVV